MYFKKFHGTAGINLIRFFLKWYFGQVQTGSRQMEYQLIHLGLILWYLDYYLAHSSKHAHFCVYFCVSPAIFEPEKGENEEESDYDDSDY